MKATTPAIHPRWIKSRHTGPLWSGPRSIEIEEMEAGLADGTLKETARGDENVYFTRADGRKVFCKCL